MQLVQFKKGIEKVWNLIIFALQCTEARTSFELDFSVALQNLCYLIKKGMTAYFVSDMINHSEIFDLGSLWYSSPVSFGITPILDDF